jgi:hypothetical protein
MKQKIAIICVVSIILSCCLNTTRYEFKGDMRVFNLVLDEAHQLLQRNYETSDDFTNIELIDAMKQAIYEWDIDSHALSKLEYDDNLANEIKIFDNTCKSGLMKYIVDRLFGNHYLLFEHNKTQRVFYIGGYLTRRIRKDAYDPGFP